MTNSATNSDMNRRSTAVGVFNDRSEAREAVQELRNAGFRDDQIGFASRDASTTPLSAQGDAVGAGVASGAVTGGILGGIIGAAAALLIPGVGPVVAGGVLATAIGGAAVGAAAGGLLGALVGMGVPEQEARYYDQEFRAGRTIVTVQAGNRYQEAEAILRRYGASFARSGAATTSMSATTTQERSRAGARPDARETADSAHAQNRNEIRVPEVEERLEVEKRPVQKGEVRLQKTVHEKEQTVPVEVMHEEVHVEKRDVERPLREGEQAFQEGTIRVPVRGEEVVTHKEAVVTGEVVVNKERTTEQQQVSDTVRRTEVHVDRANETAYPDRQETVAAHGTSDWNAVMPRYRQSWQQRYGSAGGRWEDYEPGYRYGYEMHNDPRYSGRSYDEAEADLQKDWAMHHPSTPWEKIRSSVREAWTDVTSSASR